MSSIQSDLQRRWNDKIQQERLFLEAELQANKLNIILIQGMFNARQNW